MAARQSIVSFYKFIPLDDLPLLKKSLQSLCLSEHLQGTIVIAGEGINGMLAGCEAGIGALSSFLKSDPRFADMPIKTSYHQGTIFRRMLVKIKKQCLTLRTPADPASKTGKRLAPLELKRWLDEGRDILLLDTRNDYEYAAGSFRGALDPQTKSFDEFPAWTAEHLATAKQRTIVTFCTGGIRCEKATAVMLEQGFSDVYQLDGGIISYLEQTLASEDNHWDGECIVFDKRHAVDKHLQTSTKEHCFVCLAELTAASSARVVFPAGKACSPCATKMQEHQQARQASGSARHQQNLLRRHEFILKQQRKHP